MTDLKSEDTSIQRYSILRRMMRSIKRWWILWRLRKECLFHVAKQDIEQIKLGMDIGVKKSAYLNSLSELRRNKRLNPDRLNKRLQEYNSLLSSCIGNNLITELPLSEGDDTLIKVSYLEDDFISEYWHKSTWNNAIGTGLIIMVFGGLLVWFATSQLEKIVKPQSNPVYRIQILPNGTEQK